MIRSVWLGWQGVLGDVRDSIGMRNDIRVFVCDLVVVILCDDGDGGRLHCASICHAPVVFVSSIILGGLVYTV